MPTLAESVAPTPCGEASPVAVSQAPQPPVPHPSPRTIEPLSLDRFSLRFTVDTEFLELLEKARDLGSHRVPRPDMMTVLKRSLEAYVQKLEKKRFGIGKKPRVQRRARLALKPSRYISAATLREVYARDAGRCVYVSADGKRCDSRFHLEIDHVRPFADNGPPTAANLRLLCRANNQEHARRYFGKAYVRAAIAHR